MAGSNLARRTSPARPTVVASRDGPCLEGMESPASPNPGSGEAVGKRGPAARAEAGDGRGGPRPVVVEKLTDFRHGGDEREGVGVRQG
jgi:hypothetical protein